MAEANLALPQPAAGIWTRHIATVRETLQETDAAARLLVGGGTILAARWHHRESVDIDIVLPELESIEEWMQGGRLNIAARTGGRTESESPTHITVAIGSGKLDIACYAPRPPQLETKQQVMSEECYVMSDTQILRGKIERTRRGPTRRDGYDMGVAARINPTSLAEAINAVPGKAVGECLANIAARMEFLDNDTRDRLRNVPDQYRELTTDIARTMASAITGSLYTGIRIDIKESGTEVRRTTPKGELPPQVFKHATGSEILAATALETHLRYNNTWGESARGVAHAIDEAQARGTGVAWSVGALYESGEESHGGSGTRNGNITARETKRPSGPTGPEQPAKSR